MEPNSALRNENSQKYYASLISSTPGDPTKFRKPPTITIKGGKAKSFRDIKLTQEYSDKADEILDPEVVSESIRGVLPKLANEINMPVEEAIFSPDLMIKVTEQEGYDTTRFQLAYAIAYVNLEPENFVSNPEACQAVTRLAVKYLQKLLEGSDPSPEIGEDRDHYKARVKEARNIRSKCNEALTNLSLRELILRSKFESTEPDIDRSLENSDQITIELPESMRKSKNLMAELEDILESGLSEQQFLEWQESLEKADTHGEKGMDTVRNDPGGDKDVMARERMEALHDTRVRFILKIGQCLLDRDLPWSGRIQDARVYSTNFASSGGGNKIKYIALTCQFEYQPGKYIEITILERPSRMIETDMETLKSTTKEENATYVYVSRNPRTWMDVFGNSSPGGALNFGALQRSTAVDGSTEEASIIGAKRVIHRDFSKYSSKEDQDIVIQDHLDSVVKVVLQMQSEVLANKRA